MDQRDGCLLNPEVHLHQRCLELHCINIMDQRDGCLLNREVHLCMLHSLVMLDQHSIRYDYLHCQLDYLSDTFSFSQVDLYDMRSFS